MLANAIAHKSVFAWASDYVILMNVAFVLIAVFWGFMLAAGHELAFTLYGYPNGAAPRLFITPLTALPWLLLSGPAYIGVVVTFYGVSLVFLIFNQHFFVRRYHAWAMQEDNKGRLPFPLSFFA
jgi:hypothetical protein